MSHPCLDGGPKRTRLGCTKFNEGCIKFNEGCTKGPKVCSEVRRDPQSLCNGILNEIMEHPCWNGGPRISQIGCTKFNEGCTKFCQECTKGPKMRSEVGIGPKSLCYGFLNEIVAHPCSNGGPGIIRLGCTKFNEDVPNYLKDVPRVPKWGSTRNHFVMGF